MIRDGSFDENAASETRQDQFVGMHMQHVARCINIMQGKWTSEDNDLISSANTSLYIYVGQITQKGDEKTINS